MKTNISFDNTAIAFAYKTNKELKEARLLFSMMARPWLVKIGTRLTPWAINSGLPVNGIIRNTIFKQFVGGGITGGNRSCCRKTWPVWCSGNT